MGKWTHVYNSPIFDEQAIEAAARALEPGRWAVMDSEKAAMLRKYKGQAVGYDAEQFQDTKSMMAARAALEAATHSMDARSKLHYREGLAQLQDGSWITREGHSIRRDQPVAIIRLPSLGLADIPGNPSIDGKTAKALDEFSRKIKEADSKPGGCPHCGHRHPPDGMCV